MEQLEVTAALDRITGGSPNPRPLLQTDLDQPPARPAKPELISGPIQRSQRTLSQFLLHSLAHIELNAIDIYSHTVAKWGPGGACEEDGRAITADVWHKLVQVAQDEARHFLLLDQRMRQLGFHYGAMPAHKALWSHAQESQGCLRARLGIIPLVQEAHALDSGPRLCERLNSAADHASARLVQQIVEEEVGHVAVGMEAFEAVCAAQGLKPVSAFHDLVREHVPKLLPGPFNSQLRDLAGMPAKFYEPVAAPKRRPHRA
jgi:uncharacterized ferritin-like protein (DUF455 family)